MIVVKSRNQLAEVVDMTIIYELDQLKKENENLKKEINDLRNQVTQQQKELREVVGDEPSNPGPQELIE